MNTLYPIIRRARRPLVPPDDIAPAVPPVVVEAPPVVAPVEVVTVEMAPVVSGVDYEGNPVTIDAAADGFGIALESTLMSWRELQGGTLVCPVRQPPTVGSNVPAASTTAPSARCFPRPSGSNRQGSC